MKLIRLRLAPRINRQLLHDVVVMHQANQRQGSARTKSRSEVAGAKGKMYRQKGTGRARAGLAADQYSPRRWARVCQTPTELRLPIAAKGGAGGHSHGHRLEDR